MIKSPAQWSNALNRIANTDEYVVKVEMTVHQVKEIATMMEILSRLVDIDKLKEMLDIDK